jgi:putative Holliday junction resolvase
VGRILAVDLGTKRIGLALTDPGKRIASPKETIAFVTFSKLVERLQAMCRDLDVELVVIGFPVRENGSEGEGCRRSRILEERLSAAGIGCRLWDESWSSREAEEILKMGGKTRSSAAAKTDAVAASIILRDYLESSASGPTPPAASLPESP